MAAAPQLAPLETISDNALGAFVPTSAFAYQRYRQRCKLLWRVTPAEFERYERFLGKIDDKFGLAAAEQRLETTASTLIRGDCIDYVGLEELENE